MSNKNKEQKKKPIKAIISLFLLVILTGIVFTGYNIYSRIKNVAYVELNKADLAVNSDIYSDVSGDLSESEFGEVKSVAFFGVDTRDTTAGFTGRSDTIMIASINPKNKCISLISIPRDTYVSIPGYGKDKINHAYAFGQEQLAIKTINQNFGLGITEYVTIDFAGLINVINDIGGIELDISKEEMQYINNGVGESYRISGNKVQKLSSAGLVKLTGEQALTHSRNRTVGDDFVRASRQRKVLEALLNKMSKLDMLSLMNVSNSILKEVKTNVKLSNYMGSIFNTVTNKQEYLSNMVLAQVPAANYSDGKMINGVYYFTTNYDLAKQDFVKYIYGK